MTLKPSEIPVTVEPEVDTSKEEVLRILRGAYRLLSRPNGWTKRFLKFGDSFCLIGALTYADNGNARYIPKNDNTPVGTAQDLIAREIGRTRGSLGLANWNDRIARTQRDVLSVLEGAIRKAEKL